MGFLEALSLARGVFVQGTVAIVFDGGLRIVDVSNPASPRPVGFIVGYMQPSLFAQGNHAFVIDSGLRVIDISDPAFPREVGSLENLNDPTGIFVQGNLAFVAIRRGLDIVRFSTGAKATTSASGLNLMVNVQPPEAGSIRIDPSPNLNGGYCPKTDLVVVAEPNEGFQFSAWTGDADGAENPLAITMTTDLTVEAVFSPVPTPTPAPASTQTSQPILSAELVFFTIGVQDGDTQVVGSDTDIRLFIDGAEIQGAFDEVDQFSSGSSGFVEIADLVTIPVPETSLNLLADGHVEIRIQTLQLGTGPSMDAFAIDYSD